MGSGIAGEDRLPESLASRNRYVASAWRSRLESLRRVDSGGDFPVPLVEAAALLVVEFGQREQCRADVVARAGGEVLHGGCGGEVVELAGEKPTVGFWEARSEFRTSGGETDRSTCVRSEGGTAVSLLRIFATTILPLVAIAGAGYALGSRSEIDVGSLNKVTVYVLVPALIFHSLTTTTLGGETLLKLGAGVAAYVGLMTVVVEGIGRVLGESEPLLSALVLVSVFPNSGNFGIPLSGFAFGDVGRGTAVLFLAAQSVLIYTLGVYIASRSSGASGFEGARKVFALPLVYAVAAALLVRWLGVVPPAETTAMQTLELVGNASIPLMLILLGVELSNTDVGEDLRSVGLANVFKLLLAPVVGAGVALALGFSDPTVARVFVLETATPAAVTPLILLIEFGEGADGATGAQYVSAVVFTSTLASIPVLTVLVALLESGMLV